jgi:hypothetical protein
VLSSAAVKHSAALLCLFLFACGGNEAKKPVARHAEASTPTPESTRNTDTAPAAAPAVPLELALSLERSTDGVGLHVINRGTQKVELAPDVELEQEQNSRFAKLQGQGLKLRFDCKSQGCIALAPGAELVAPAWLGRAEGERCDALVRLPSSGHFRLVVHACQGSGRSELAFVQSTPP